MTVCRNPSGGGIGDAGIIGGDLEVTEKVLTSKRIIFDLVNSDSLNTNC